MATNSQRPPSQIPESPGSRTPGPPAQEPFSWKAWLLLGLLLAAMALWQSSQQRETYPSIDYSDFYRLLEAGRVERVTKKGQTVLGKLKQPETVGTESIQNFQTYTPSNDPQLLEQLKKLPHYGETNEEQPFAVQLLATLLPWVLIIGVWIWLSRRAQQMMTGGGPLAGMLKGKSRRFDKQASVSVTFADVAGLKSAKRDLMEVVAFLKEPTRFKRLGGKVPRGVLLVGPPGTGKTLLARAVAGEAGVPFFSISGSEFIELFVGVGASRVRELFAEARKVTPAIVFIDEIDAVGRSRGSGMGGGNDEREQTLNQLLSEMDGFDRNDLTIILAATNRPDVLDPALLRPGRFDRRVMVDRPELGARRAILDVHVKGKPLAADVDLDHLARDTPGFSGADLANLVNEAALNATRRNADALSARDFSDAYEKIVLGDLREGKLDPEERDRVAIHESGHAVVAHLSPHAEPLRRVTIIPRGMALGVTQQTPGADRHIMTQPEMESRLSVLMGGYSAERAVLGDVSSGAENDLKQATDLAFKMVAHFGMSDKLGPVFHEHKVEHPFLGASVTSDGGTSQVTLHIIEEEARKILAAAQKRAETLIRENRDVLDRLVQGLLEKETLENEDLTLALGRPKVEAGPRRAANALH
jgi:cell division protease FtsH